MELEEQFFELDRVKLRRWLPWLHLWRAFRLAIHPRAVLLGCLAILLLDAAFAGLGALPFATDWAKAEAPDRGERIASTSIDSLSLTWDKAYVQPFATVQDAFTHGWLVLSPVSEHVPAAYHLFHAGGGVTGTATAVTALLLCLLVWSICGVGIARTSAVRFAVDQPVRLREAIGFSLRNLISSLGAVILPMLAVLSLWFAGVLLGWLGHIPAVGGAIVGLGWGLMMLAGLAMSLILLGLAVGWPLMLASIAVEDADAFDAFSRVYNYVYARPWYALFLVLLAMLYGSALIVFTATLLTTTNVLAAWAVSAGIAELDSPFGMQAVATWQNIGGLVLHGFIVSYFWTATTIVYVLLRKSEDATPLEAITLPVTAPVGEEEVPLVGIPAVERREGVDPANPQAGDEAE